MKRLNWKITTAVIVIVALTFTVARLDRPGDIDSADSSSSLAIQSWKTDNGARVVFVPADELPMVDVRVVFDAGSARDGELPGLARMTAGMLNEGAGDWDTDELAKRFDDIGANYSASAKRDMAAFSLRTLVDKPLREQALSTFASILGEPTFPREAFNRVRRNTLVSLQNKKQSPGDLAEDKFYKELFGEHPYATPVSGEEASVKAIQRADLRAFYKEHMVASNAVVAIVGKLSREQAEALAEQVTGKLESGEPAPSLPEVEPLPEAKRVDLSHPSAQTHILVGQPGMRRGDRDYFSLYVGNHILGGSGFGSRIMETIREDRGLAYSSYSYFVPQRVNGAFIMGLQTSNKQTEQALGLLQEVLVKFIDEGPTEEELQHAKKNITGGFPLRIDSNKDIVEYLAMIGFYDLPHDYLDTFNDNVEDITAADIREAFQRRIDPEKLLTVTVGNGNSSE
ncbi:M16 family metallopeptidase [Thiohalophilus thiocyanatoxydans]|uniref:Zinc protease n=1 Tax=Thiohalophilus thiocyanatoxydans TaxID=381308 RepID=A0A4R8IST2_9GAMM|nr:pitrilysin family protein [Thiohalophilus thiocyanatoxydans]TDY04111.1 zinc protease [Thiohalophilus thiocyanatoxydans]